MATATDLRERLNLSRWALAHRPLVLFLLLAIVAAGTLSYLRLGRAEDPDFTIKVMVVQAFWPGATARDTQLQVTDKLEKVLQQVPYYDYSTSYSKPGETVIKVILKDITPKAQVAESWYQVRKRIGDIRNSLPQGVVGPFFNDEFGDTFGTIYAFSADGFSDAELKKFVEDARQRLLKVRHVNKVELIGAQDEKVFVEFSHAKLAMLGVTPAQVFESLQKHNAVAAAGTVETPTDRVPLRIATIMDSVEAVREVPVAQGGRTLRLGDIAEVTRGYQDPKAFTMRFNGKPVIGLTVSMAKDGNNLEMGEALQAEMAKIKRELPVGVEVEQVADQPTVVKRSSDEFFRSLLEALAIVLAVSFISLGLRTGIVVALSVPLVLAATFVVMEIIGINLHRISLGALIIALGLLVDDAIIAVETMVVKMEEGMDRLAAGTYAYTATAFPMLTGTLITAAGFIPVGFAKSTAGEYTNAIFWVVGVSLIISWIVAVIFTPYIGFKLLPKPKAGHHDVYGGRVYRMLRRAVEWCVTWRKSVIALTLLAFVAAIAGFRYIPQQFFPSASRPELMVDLRLPEGAGFAATERVVQRLEKVLASDLNVAHYVAYTGGGTPRFYLPLNPELRLANFAQFVVMARGLEEREVVYAKLQQLFDTEFDGLRARVMRLENGPPVGFPVQFRVIGEDPQVIRDIAYRVRDTMRQNPHLRDVNLDWNELSKVVRLEIDRDRARALGVNPQDLSNTLNTLISGLAVTQFRDGTELIDVVARAVPGERLDLSGLESINVGRAGGGTVPLSQVARVKYELEEPMLWRRNRETMITVRGDISDGTQAPVVSQQVEPTLAAIKASLPDGYRIDRGGAIEESAKSQASIAAMMPLMVLVMLAILMVQTMSFSRTFLVLLTAPFGLIGVAAALLITRQPMGFVAMLGIIALAGMIMRNTVILVDQIDRNIAEGKPMRLAIVEAAVRRTRPIVLTALAAILAMIPLSRSVFWGPMAIAIMGGLAVATVLTIFVVPSLYAAWFRIGKTQKQAVSIPAGAMPAPAE
jgi:multidrug efflux pump